MTVFESRSEIGTVFCGHSIMRVKVAQRCFKRRCLGEMMKLETELRSTDKLHLTARCARGGAWEMDGK